LPPSCLAVWGERTAPPIYYLCWDVQVWCAQCAIRPVKTCTALAEASVFV
jgi:hypothetical protein